MIKCQICQKEFKLLAYKHLQTHGVTFEEYKQMFPNCSLSSLETKRKQSNNTKEFFKNMSEFAKEERSKKISKANKGKTWDVMFDKKEFIKRKNERRNLMLRLIKEGKIPQTLSTPHKLLVQKMKEHNLWDNFENEVKLGFYSLDIANKKQKIAIQVDGDYWHSNPKFWPNGPIYKAQKTNTQYDKARETYFKNNLKDWILLRFWEYDIKNNINNCITKIIAALEGNF